MASASYFDPDRDETVHAGHIDENDVAALIGTVTSLSSRRGHPALELVRDDGTALSIGTDGQRAVLVWTNSLGDSLHSVGGAGEGVLIYDDFGFMDRPGPGRLTS